MACTGSRPVDADTGDQGGPLRACFVSEWQGDILYDATRYRRALRAAYAVPPEARGPTRGSAAPDAALARELPPDGGQLFFPLDQRPFYVPLARPGDDVTPERVVCFRFDGRHGLYIHPNIWHEGVFGARGTQRFFDKQGAVHARVSVDFAREFGCLLEVTL
jgi:hypothetical protein